MTTAVNDIVDRAETILQDTTNVRWPSAELVDWLNAGQVEVVLLKPNSHVTHAAVVLVISETKQSIPSAGIQLIDVVRNMGTGGSTPGDAIRLIDRKLLDEQVPDWHSATGSAVVKHFMFDPRNPRNFFVYPPQPGSSPGYVDIVYSATPAAASAGGNITLGDEYANVLLDYILYRAYQKDADYAENSQRAALYYQAFIGALGKKESNEGN